MALKFEVAETLKQGDTQVAAPHNHSGFIIWNSDWIQIKNPCGPLSVNDLLQASRKYFCFPCIIIFFQKREKKDVLTMPFTIRDIPNVCVSREKLSEH